MIAHPPLYYAHRFARETGSGTYNPGTDTTPSLRVYRFPSDFDAEAWALARGWKIEVFSFAAERFRVPNLRGNGYGNGTVWIYDPADAEGAFRDHEIGEAASVRYTRRWRVTHEVGHAETEPAMQALYGDSRRDGRLGRPMQRMVGRPGRQVPVTRRALTLAEAMRAVHWEVVTFERQRAIMVEIGASVTDSEYAREFNTNLTDAVARVCGGDFTNPGRDGFNPSDEPVTLSAALNFLRSINDGLGM